jgi:hypothetical protein
MEHLLKLYSFESVHNTPDEVAIADYIEGLLKDWGVPYTRSGNCLYNLDQPDMPILSAHLDQVKTNGKAEHFVMTPENHIIGYNKNWQRTSLGGDDKNGVWIILKMLEAGFYTNFIISEGEESGCIGIHNLERKGVLDKITPLDTYCIVLDRKGNKDVLRSGSGTTFCSTLAQSLCNFWGNQKWEVGSGSISDTCTLCEYCESVNISVSYFNPHSATEYTDWNNLKDTLEDIKDMVESFVHFPTPPEIYRPKSTYYSKKGLKDDYDEKDWWQRYY